MEFSSHTGLIWYLYTLVVEMMFRFCQESDSQGHSFPGTTPKRVNMSDCEESWLIWWIAIQAECAVSREDTLTGISILASTLKTSVIIQGPISCMTVVWYLRWPRGLMALWIHLTFEIFTLSQKSWRMRILEHTESRIFYNKTMYLKMACAMRKK